MYGPKPGPAHAHLARLAGTWDGEETMHPSPWAPEGMVAKALTVNRPALGGFGVVTDYEQRQGEQVTFSGHGVHTADSETGEHVLHWFDCMGGQREEFRGKWEGDRLTLRSSREASGPMPPHTRIIYIFESPTQFKMQMALSTDGETWAPLVDGVYQRTDA